uniref:Uncharacterized protein n=1 Tax=Anguilla anguilla TaxID=7936 RepID=A0A0E9P667_ANGAN
MNSGAGILSLSLNRD